MEVWPSAAKKKNGTGLGGWKATNDERPGRSPSGLQVEIWFASRILRLNVKHMVCRFLSDCCYRDHENVDKCFCSQPDRRPKPPTITPWPWKCNSRRELTGSVVPMEEGLSSEARVRMQDLSREREREEEKIWSTSFSLTYRQTIRVGCKDAIRSSHEDPLSFVLRNLSGHKKPWTTVKGRLGSSSQRTFVVQATRWKQSWQLRFENCWRIDSRATKW